MSYATLQTDLANWLDRTDLASLVPMFVSFAEAKFNEKIRHRSMEAAYNAVSLVNGSAALPSDFKAFKYLITTTGQQRTLSSTTAEYIKSLGTSTDTPVYYAIDGANVICYPQVGSIQGVYYKTIPSLQSSSTNWLDTYRHDLYVYECLSHACLYIKDNERAMMYEAKANAIINDIMATTKAESISGSPLTQRVR